METIPESRPALDTNTKYRLIVLLLAISLGTFGVHRFYVGRKVSGSLFLAITLLSMMLSTAIQQLSLHVLLPTVISGNNAAIQAFMKLSLLPTLGTISLDTAMLGVMIMTIIDTIQIGSGRFKDARGVIITTWREPVMINDNTISPKNSAVATALSILLGVFFAHRFYLGRTKSALMLVLTLPVILALMLINFILITSDMPVDLVTIVFLLAICWLLLLIVMIIAIVDRVKLITGQFKDGQGRYVRRWQ